MSNPKNPFKQHRPGIARLGQLRHVEIATYQEYVLLYLKAPVPVGNGSKNVEFQCLQTTEQAKSLGKELSSAAVAVSQKIN